MREIAELAEEEGFAVHWGRKVLEVRPPVALDKGLGIAQRCCATLPRRPRALYVGDDSTDLDAFRGAARARRRRRRSSSRCAWPSAPRRHHPSWPREADLIVDGQAGVRGLLEALL